MKMLTFRKVLSLGLVCSLLIGIIWLTSGDRFSNEHDDSSEGSTEFRSKNHRPLSASEPSKLDRVQTKYTVDDIVEVYTKEGLAAALKLAKSIIDEKDRASQIYFILSYATKYEPENIAALYDEIELSSAHRRMLMWGIMRSWKDGPAALRWADTLKGDLRKGAVGSALGILVESDPQAALDYLATIPKSGSRRQAIGNLFLAWGRIDPEAALAAVDNHLAEGEIVGAIDLSLIHI